MCPEEMGGDVQFQLGVEDPFSAALSSSDTSSFAPALRQPHSQVCPAIGRGARGMESGEMVRELEWGDWGGVLSCL